MHLGSIYVGHKKKDFNVLLYWSTDTCENNCNVHNKLEFSPSSQDDKALIERSLEDSERVQVKHFVYSIKLETISSVPLI